MYNIDRCVCTCTHVCLSLSLLYLSLVCNNWEKVSIVLFSGCHNKVYSRQTGNPDETEEEG